MNIYEKIRARREELKLTIEDVAKALGVNKSTVSRYESEQIKKMSIDMIEPLADVLKCTPEYLMGWEDNTSDIIPIKTYSGYQLPIFEYIPASCGSGSWDEDEVIDYIVLPASIYRFNKHKKYFGQIAKGDSMIGVDINDGDLLVFEQCNTPENNMVGTFSLNNEKCFCKRVKIKDGKVFLVSENSDYMPIEITEDMDFKMVGLLKYIVKEFRQALGE